MAIMTTPCIPLRLNSFLASFLALVAAAGCTADGPGDGDRAAPTFAGISAGETVRFTGTEPFWGGEVTGGMLTYSTPENIAGERFAVSRFAGLNGVSWSGRLGGAPFDLAVTEGRCSDGMSDRTYPFAATLSVRGETRRGCAWTAARPFIGGEPGPTEVDTGSES